MRRDANDDRDVRIFELESALREIHETLNPVCPGDVGGTPAHRIAMYEAAIALAFSIADGAL
jgi:hypothetical protein